MATSRSEAPKADQPITISTDDQGRIFTTADELQKVRNEWALSIGRFIVAFAECECWTYLYVQSYCTAAESEAINKEHSRRRLSLLKKMLFKKQLTTETKKKLNEAIERLRQLISTRNTLAHNAPMIQMRHQDGTEKFEVRHVLRSSRDPSRLITVKQLNREFAEATSIEEELALLYGSLQKEFRARRAQL